MYRPGPCGKQAAARPSCVVIGGLRTRLEADAAGRIGLRGLVEGMKSSTVRQIRGLVAISTGSLPAIRGVAKRHPPGCGIATDRPPPVAISRGLLQDPASD